MNDAKQNLAAAVRDARTQLGLLQERLAEIMNIDSRTILNIEAGRGNPKFEKLYPLITYLKIPTSKIFDLDYVLYALIIQQLRRFVVSYFPLPFSDCHYHLPIFLPALF